MNKFILLLFIGLLSCNQNKSIDKENALNRYLGIKGNVKSFVEKTQRLNDSNIEMIIKSMIVNDTCIQNNCIFDSKSRNRIIYTEESLSNESISNTDISEFIIVFGEPNADSSYCIVDDRGIIKKGYVKYLNSGYIKEYHAEDCEGFIEYDKNNNPIFIKYKRNGDRYFTTAYEYLEFDSKENWTKRLQTIKSAINVQSIQFREYEYK